MSETPICDEEPPNGWEDYVWGWRKLFGKLPAHGVVLRTWSSARKPWAYRHNGHSGSVTAQGKAQTMEDAALAADAAYAEAMELERIEPDLTRLALERAVRLLCWDKCPNSLELPSPWWDGCKLSRPTGPNALDGVFNSCGSDQQEECWLAYLLERAAKQLAAEQAEEATNED